MYTAQMPDMGPFVIRYPRGCGYCTDLKSSLEPISVGKGRLLKEGRDVAILSLGPIGHEVEKAIRHAEQVNPQLSVAHYDMRFLKPLDMEIVQHVGQHFSRIITVEDGVRQGGFGSAVIEQLAGLHMTGIEVERLGLPDRFVEHGSPEELYKIVGLDAESIENVILQKRS